jgi:hypothetical protein
MIKKTVVIIHNDDSISFVKSYSYHLVYNKMDKEYKRRTNDININLTKFFSESFKWNDNTGVEIAYDNLKRLEGKKNIQKVLIYKINDIERYLKIKTLKEKCQTK